MRYTLQALRRSARDSSPVGSALARDGGSRGRREEVDVPIELDDISVGKVDFIERYDLWTDEQKEAAGRVNELVKEGNFRTVRVSWPDQHGILRGKTLTSNAFLHAMRNGQDMQTAVLIMDTVNRIIFPLFRSGGGFGIPEMTGYPDMILVPDPLSFRELPWAPGTGWCLSDAYFQNGKPVPFSSRYVMRQWLENLAEEGYEYVSGLEVEWYITKMEDKMLLPEQSGWPPEPPKVRAIAHGFQYLTEMRQDEIDDILSILEKQLGDLGLPLRTMEDEWGPGQCEFTFHPRMGLESADNMVLFRTAAKQICRRNGYHASFMCRPNLPNFFSSGWHLHESLRTIETQENAFTNRAEDGEWGTGEWLSEVGKYFVGGLLEQASAQCVFSTPTINGYKRFRPDSFAPDKITWALENRAAYIRVVSAGPGDEAAHIENRAGEPAANPYLYMASQIIAGLHGIHNKIDPGPMDEEPYVVDKPLLPRSLMEAMEALKQSTVFREALGDPFMEFFTAVKNSEIESYLASVTGDDGVVQEDHLSTVTDWEHTEYFEVY
jgi:glutamine synthetase